MTHEEQLAANKAIVDRATKKIEADPEAATFFASIPVSPAYACNPDESGGVADEEPSIGFDITKQGNACGFTATEETVVGMYDRKIGAWTIYVEGEGGPNLADSRKRNFPSKAEAHAYASSLIDPETTARLAWW